MKPISTFVIAVLIAAGYPIGVAQGAEEEKVQVSQKQPFGKYLTDEDGHALYLLTADKRNASNCYDACAKAWPPAVTTGKPEVGAGINKRMLTTTKRRDGEMQVTYNGHPLYYYEGDKQAGSTTGQDLHGFGGEWYLLSPKGTKIEAKD